MTTDCVWTNTAIQRPWRPFGEFSPETHVCLGVLCFCFFGFIHKWMPWQQHPHLHAALTRSRKDLFFFLFPRRPVCSDFRKHRWYQFIRVLIQSEQAGPGRCSWACWRNGWHCHTKHIRPQLVPTSCSKLNRESVRFSELPAPRILTKKFSKRHCRVSPIQPCVFGDDCSPSHPPFQSYFFSPPQKWWHGIIS